MSEPFWDAGSPALGLPALQGHVEADVCVVGLGGSGLAAVGEALALGCSVVGLDAGAVAGGAAGRNAGFLLAGAAPFYHRLADRLGRERAAALYLLTMAEIDRMEAETPSLVEREGSLRLATSPDEEADCERQRSAMAAHGLPVEPYEGPEGRGLLLPTDGATDPRRRCLELARRALSGGARLFERSPMTEVWRAPGRVDTPSGAVSCRAVVVAVDGGLERVVPALAGRVRTARAQMLATAPVERSRGPRRPVYARWGYDYWRRLAGGEVVLGGGRDVGGDAEWTGEAEPSPRVQAHLDRLLADVAGPGARVTHRWAGTIAYTTTGLPVLAEVRPGMVAAGGYCGTGNVVGAICGRAAAQLAATGASALADVLRG